MAGAIEVTKGREGPARAGKAGGAEGTGWGTLALQDILKPQPLRVPRDVTITTVP